MLGVQHQRDVKGALHNFVGFLAGQGVQKIARETQRRIARHHVLPVPQPVEAGDDGRRLGHQPGGFFRGSGDRNVVGVRIVQRQHRHRGPQHMHRRRLGHALQKRFHARRKRTIGHQGSLQLVEFSAIRQAPVPQQVHDFFKRGVLGEGSRCDSPGN